MSHKMNLFKVKDQPKPTSLEPLISKTPIGNLNFNIHFFENSLLSCNPQLVELIDDKAIIATWIFDECQIEFLRLNINPHLPAGMKVVQCLSGIWRLKILKGSSVFDFECNLDYQGPNSSHELDVHIESGEGLAAQTWENPFLRLTIGTEDEDYLQQRAANRDWLPHRFKSLIDTNSIQYSKNGIKVILPELKENDTVQIHFTIAWTYKEIATWFAVDERVEDILKQVAIE